MAYPVAAVALVVATALPAQTTLIPPDQIVALVNAELRDAELRLHSQGEWRSRDRTFFRNDSWLRLLDSTRVVPLQEVRLEPRSGFGIHYYFNASDIRTDSIRLTRDADRYALHLFFERAGAEIKGMCRWRRTNGDFTQCRPSGNDRPAPDVHFTHFSVHVPVEPVIDGLGFTVVPVACEDIDVRLEADINGLLGLGDNNLPERVVGRRLRGEVRESLCSMMTDEDAFRSALGSRTGLRLAELPVLADAGGVRPIRFTSAGALEVELRPAVLDVSVGFEPAGGSCPQPVVARIAVATDRPRTVRARLQDGERTGPWFTLASEPISLGGGGYAAVVDRPLGWELDGGQHRVRLEVEGHEPTKWSRVNVTCATRTPPPTRAEVEPSEGPRKAGECPVHVHFTGTLVVPGPGRYTYHFMGDDGSRTQERSFTANAPGSTEVFWNRRVPASAPPGTPLPRTVGGWTQLVVREERDGQRPRTTFSDRAPFQVHCTNGTLELRRPPG